MFATQEVQPTNDEPTSLSWESRAACRRPGVPAGLFFSENLSDIASAKRICASCPVMSECLEQAIHNEEPWGVWGGQLFCNGKTLLVKRRRGRPPKHPRPEDQIPLIPIPDHLRELVRTA